MRKQEPYWAFRASDIPEISDLPAGTFVGDDRSWESLSPGFRRTIFQEATKRSKVEQPVLTEDAERLERAAAIQKQTEVQIAAREAV